MTHATTHHGFHRTYACNLTIVRWLSRAFPWLAATPNISNPPPAVPAPEASSPAAPVVVDTGSVVPNDGTANDLRTAIGLFGAVVVDQVETSVMSVLNENRQMREIASEMATAASQANEQFARSMEAASETETCITRLGTANEGLAGAIAVIGREVRRTLDVVGHSTAQAASTRARVESLTGLAHEVSQATGTIDDIARQTRMLALNAKIEATRGGAAGAGFGVVAAEVKELAGQTAVATQQIGARLASMLQTSGASRDALLELVGIISAIEEAGGCIMEAMAEQERFALAVSGGLQQMQGAVFELSRQVREAAQIAANSGMLAELVLDTANSVDSQMTSLRERLQQVGSGMAPDLFPAQPDAGVTHALQAGKLT